MIITASTNVSGLGHIATIAMAAIMVIQACATIANPRQLERCRTSASCCGVINSRAAMRGAVRCGA